MCLHVIGCRAKKMMSFLVGRWVSIHTHTHTQTQCGERIEGRDPDSWQQADEEKWAHREREMDSVGGLKLRQEKWNG